MSMHGFPAGPPKAVSVMGKNAAGTIATVIAAAIFFVIIVVSLFGSAEDGEPKQVFKIDRATPSGSGGPSDSAAPVVSGELLTASNGVVISDPALLENSTDGPLPRIASDGRKAMQIYARPFDASDPRPRIAVIVGGLGLGEAVTQAAVDRLPPGVTLAFTPYGSSLQSVVSTARAKGHEVLLEVPMEPFDYPSNDPGQNTLLTGVAAADNPVRLRWLLSRVTGYAGLINSQGAKYLSSQDDVRFVVGEANRRGLYLVDNGESEQSIAREVAQGAGASFARGDVQIDQNPIREAIERELAALETFAKQRGSAIGVAGAFPVTVDRLSTWAAGLEQKGIALAPVSAVINTAPAVAPAPAVSAPADPPVPAPKPRPAAKPAATRPSAASQLPTDPEPAFQTAPHP